MPERVAQFRVALQGREELASFFARSEQGASGFATSVQRHLGDAGRAIGSFASSIGSVLTPLAGIGLGAGLAQQARGVIEFRDALAGLAANADLPAEKIKGLREEILQTGLATNQAAGDMVEGLNSFIAKTGDLEQGRKNLQLFGEVALATRSKVKDIAEVGAELSKLKIANQGEALAILAKQSDVGSVELRDLVTQGPRLISAFQGAGLQGVEGLRAGGALAQVFQKGTGNVDRTSTAVEAAFRDLAEKAPQLHGGGVEVFDAAGLPRDRVEVLLETVRRAKGKEQVLRRIFGDEAMRGVQVLASEFRETGGFGTFEKYRDVEADRSLLDRKMALNRGTAAARLQATQNRLLAATDRQLGDQIDAGVSGSSKLVDAAEWALANPGSATLAAGGAWGAKKALGWGAGKLWDRAFGSGGGAAAGIGGALAGGEGSRVFVTNWPADGIKNGGGELGKNGWLGGVARIGGVLASAVAAKEAAAVGGELGGGLAKNAGGGTVAQGAGTFLGAGTLGTLMLPGAGMLMGAAELYKRWSRPEASGGNAATEKPGEITPPQGRATTGDAAGFQGLAAAHRSAERKEGSPQRVTPQWSDALAPFNRPGLDTQRQPQALPTPPAVGSDRDVQVGFKVTLNPDSKLAQVLALKLEQGTRDAESMARRLVGLFGGGR